MSHDFILDQLDDLIEAASKDPHFNLLKQIQYLREEIADSTQEVAA